MCRRPIKELSKQGALCMEGIRWMCCWESVQKSQCIFKTEPTNIMNPSKIFCHFPYLDRRANWITFAHASLWGRIAMRKAQSAHCWALLLCRLRLHLCVLVCPAAVVIDWSSLSHRGQLWMRRLPDSCAGTDCDPCCQVTEPFYPRRSLSTAQCLPSASSLSCFNDKTHVRL